jgi:hypothetical protein
MFDKFMQTYREQLIAAMTAHPEDYDYTAAPADIDRVCRKMGDAFLQRTYNKDGRAIKATCKVLGIKYTYGAINTYLVGGKPDATDQTT